MQNPASSFAANLHAFGNPQHGKNIFPEFIGELDVRPLGMSGRTVRLLRLRPQILATPDQLEFLFSWLSVAERLQVVQQVKEDRGLWASPVWDQSQLELWLDVLALAAGHSWTEGWDSFAAHSSVASLSSFAEQLRCNSDA